MRPPNAPCGAVINMASGYMSTQSLALTRVHFVDFPPAISLRNVGLPGFSGVHVSAPFDVTPESWTLSGGLAVEVQHRETPLGRAGLSGWRWGLALCCRAVRRRDELAARLGDLLTVFRST